MEAESQYMGRFVDDLGRLISRPSSEWPMTKTLTRLVAFSSSRK